MVSTSTLYNHQIDSLAKSILTTAIYFDLFEYPLTVEQLYCYLPQNTVTVDDVHKTAASLVSNRLLQKESHYYFLPYRNKTIVHRRIDEEHRAAKKIKYARIAASVIKRFPFVRAVFLTGSLSKNIFSPSADVDFMIVTSPGRLWICKAVLTAFRKIFLFGSKKYFCTNYYVTENHLQLHQRNYYTAIEVITTKAIWNAEALMEFQKVNQWTKQFLPNANVQTDISLQISSGRSIIQKIIEPAMNIFPLEHVDSFLMNTFRRRWKNVYNNIPDDIFDTRFLISREESACWPEDRQVPTMNRFYQSLAAAGIDYPR